MHTHEIQASRGHWAGRACLGEQEGGARRQQRGEDLGRWRQTRGGYGLEERMRTSTSAGNAAPEDRQREGSMDTPRASIGWPYG